MEPEMTEEEIEGVRAIIYLELASNFSEYKKSALSNWRKMSEGEKQLTVYFYKKIFNKD